MRSVSSKYLNAYITGSTYAEEHAELGEVGFYFDSISSPKKASTGIFNQNTIISEHTLYYVLGY